MSTEGASSSYTSRRWKYDVIVSFVGEDSRKDFIDPLYSALTREGIDVYRDDKEHPRPGKTVALEILEAIEKSRISVVVFSRNYASSTWCLDELVKILECINTREQMAIPIYYDVDPSIVRRQTAIFGEAFARHEEIFKGNLVQKWRSALTTVANIPGWELKDRNGREFIQHVVKEISLQLGLISTNTNVRDLVGPNIPSTASMSTEGASSSYTSPIWKYDVFISFMGSDTGKNFIDHLHFALTQKGINVFRDDDTEYVRSGKAIAPEILGAVENSGFSIVVFSRNYASSTWCLDELVKIVECINTRHQKAFPIYYDVDPSIVSRQTENFEEAFAIHEQRFEGNKVQKWRSALTTVANLSGWELRDWRIKAEFIQHVVKEISRELSLISANMRLRDLVGLNEPLNELMMLINEGSNDVRMIGICGMGGIGKTTLARVIYDLISFKFEGSSFLANVREKLEVGGMIALQKQLLEEILHLKDANLDLSDHHRIFMLRHKKVLVVIDDVTHLIQLRKLAGKHMRFGLGSRIIITARDEHLLKSHGVDHVYKVEVLNDDDAFSLFSLKAFKNREPSKEYLKLSKSVIKYASGLPLALNVLGSFLCDKRIDEWESALEKLYKVSTNEVLGILRISFDGLCNIEKAIFLDIACFFNGKSRDYVTRILDACDFSATIGITVLVEKSLINISEHNELLMHSLLQEMGRQIVKRESLREPGKRSRLWEEADIFHVLTKNTGTEAVEGIWLDMSKIRDIHLNPHAFKRMRNLRILKLHCSDYEASWNKVHGFESQDSILTKLRYLHWHKFPLKSFSSKFDPEKLVVLDMPHSNLKQLWNGIQQVFNLKHINLSHSVYLTTIPDLILAENLESLVLQGCTSLIEIPSSIQNLTKLVILNLSDCKSLSTLPSDIQSKRLINVILSGCSNLKMAPRISCNVKRLYLKGTSIKELPLIENPSRLVVLDLENCSKLEKLPNSFCDLKSLEYLVLSGCSRLDRLPNNLGNLESLVDLEAKDTAIAELPSSIVCLDRLQKLSFSQCKGLVLPPLSGLNFLTSLDLSYCQITNLPESIGGLCSLEWLSLTGNNFERIPASIKDLFNLFFIDLSYCERLQSLPELPSGLNVQVRNCTSLEEFSDLSFLFSPVSRGQKVNLANCFQLNQSALRSKVEDGLPKIQHRKFYGELNGTIYFPGNEIPMWFNFQNTGSLIELPPGWINKNFLGFALCVVVTFQDHHIVGEDFFVRCICTTKSEGGEMEQRLGLLDAWDSDGQEYVGSDHVFLGYHFYMCQPMDDRYIALNSSNKASIEFHVESSDCLRTGCCKVEKCGVHLLYAQDCGAPVAGSSRSFKFEKKRKRNHNARD